MQHSISFRSLISPWPNASTNFSSGHLNDVHLFKNDLCTWNSWFDHWNILFGTTSSPDSFRKSCNALKNCEKWAMGMPNGISCSCEMNVQQPRTNWSQLTVVYAHKIINQKWNKTKYLHCPADWVERLTYRISRNARKNSCLFVFV